MKNLTWQNPEQLFVAQELINKVKSKCCGIKGIEKRYENSICFNADYIGEGYDKQSTDEEMRFINSVKKSTGLLLDETYSGKAMFGMMNYIKKHDIKGNIMFWLTGGPLNSNI